MFSLESLCLETIVESFPRLNCAFTTSKDASVQRNFKFLQRRYSDYLARKLLEDEKNTDEYFDFLINENLKYLEFDCFRNSPYLDSIDDIFCRLPNLTKISFSICGDEVLKSVTKFCASIVEIVATNSGVSDKGVKYLCEKRNGVFPCPKIRNISVSSSLVTDSGVKHLIQHLPFIQKLEYNELPQVLHSIYNEILSKCLKVHSKNLPFRQKLECNKLPRALHSLDNKKLSKYLKVHSYNLTELDLGDCMHLSYLADVIKACVTVCPKLEDIYCIVFESEQLDAFKCSNLKKLNLRCLLQPLNVDNLLSVNGRKLIFLRISNCILSASVLAEHCPAMETIELISVHFTNVDVQLSFPNLTKFSIRKCITRTVKIFNLFFSSSPRLEFLLFQYANFKDENFIRNGSSVIKSIEFSDICFDISYLRNMLLNYDSLKQLLLRNCMFDVSNAREILSGMAETLPNRPEIMCEQVY